MGTTEEFLDLLVRVKGAAALEDLKKVLAEVTAEEKKLQSTLGQSEINEAALTAQTEKLAAANARLKDGLGQSTNKMAGMGQSALQAGYAMQDLAQGGVGGVINNIAGLTQSLGGGAGLAGVLTLVGVGFLMLKPKIMEAAEAMGLFGENTETTKQQIDALKKKVDELEKKPGKLFIDMQQLNEANTQMGTLEKRLAAFNKARVTAAESDLASRADKAARETMGSEGLKKAIFEADTLAGRSFGKGADEVEAAALREKIGTLQARAAKLKDPETAERARLEAEMYAGQLEPIMVRINEANLAHAEARASAFLAGDVGAIAEMKGRAAKTPGAFAPEFRKELGMLPGSAEEWAMMRRGEKESAKESADLAREKTMRDEDKKTATKAATEVEKTRAPVETFIERQAKVLTDFEATQLKRREARVGVFTKQAEKGTYDEFAAAKAAELQAEGGYTSSKGRFIPLDAGGQRAALAGELEKRIGGEYGGASKGVAANLTRGAFDEVGRQKTEMMATGTMNEMQVNQAIIANTQAILAKQLETLMGESRKTGKALTGTNMRLRTMMRRVD